MMTATLLPVNHPFVTYRYLKPRIPAAKPNSTMVIKETNAYDEVFKYWLQVNESCDSGGNNNIWTTVFRVRGNDHEGRLAISLRAVSTGRISPPCHAGLATQRQTLIFVFWITGHDGPEAFMPVGEPERFLQGRPVPCRPGQVPSPTRPQA